MIDRLREALGLVAVVAAAGCAATSVGQRRYLEHATPDLVVMTDGSAEHAAELAAEIATFRDALAVLSQMAPPERSVPVRVIELGAGDLRRVLGGGHFAGLMLARLEDHLALISTGRSDPSSRVALYHELVHTFMRDSGARYPEWYEEGLAEFLSTAKVRGRAVELGRPPPRAGLLALQREARGVHEDAPVGTHLVKPSTEAEEADRHYAMYWATVDYLLLGHTDGRGPDRRGQVADYLIEYGRTGDDAAACRQAFGMTRDELDAKVMAYVGAGTVALVSVTAPSERPAAAVTAKASRPEAVACALADVALVSRNYAGAQALYELAAQTEGDGGCGLVGLVHQLMNRGEAAEAERQVAVRQGRSPDDPAALVARAEVLLGPLSPSGKPSPSVTPERLEAGRADLRQVLTAHPEHALANLRLAASYRVGGDDLAPALAAIAKVLATGTSYPAAWVTAGDLYARAGKHHQAEAALRAAMRMRGGAEVAEAQSVLQALYARGP